MLVTKPTFYSKFHKIFAEKFSQKVCSLNVQMLVLCQLVTNVLSCECAIMFSSFVPQYLGVPVTEEIRRRA